MSFNSSLLQVSNTLCTLHEKLFIFNYSDSILKCIGNWYNMEVLFTLYIILRFRDDDKKEEQKMVPYNILWISKSIKQNITISIYATVGRASLLIYNSKLIYLLYNHYVSIYIYPKRVYDTIICVGSQILLRVDFLREYYIIILLTNIIYNTRGIRYV